MTENKQKFVLYEEDRHLGIQVQTRIGNLTEEQVEQIAPGQLDELARKSKRHG